VPEIDDILDVEDLEEVIEAETEYLLQDDETSTTTWFQAVRKTVSKKNFTIFLLTAWIYSMQRRR
jgi:hypothetical protein